MLAIKDSRLHPLWGDAVQFDYENELPWMPNRVIANLPYHITTPLLWVFLEKLVPHGLDYMLLMVQLESAQRITSPRASGTFAPQDNSRGDGNVRDTEERSSIRIQASAQSKFMHH